MPTMEPLFTAAVAGNIATSVWDVLSANFVGVAVLLGFMLGLGILAKAINAGKKGKVKLT